MSSEWIAGGGEKERWSRMRNELHFNIQRRLQRVGANFVSIGQAVRCMTADAPFCHYSAVRFINCDFVCVGCVVNRRFTDIMLQMQKT